MTEPDARPVLIPIREKLIATIALSVMNNHGQTLPPKQLNTIADAILADYKIEKRPEPRHWPAYDHTVTCRLCGEHWPCAAGLNEAWNKTANEITVSTIDGTPL